PARSRSKTSAAPSGSWKACVRVRPRRALILAFVLLGPFPASAESFRVIVPRSAPAPVSFGATEMARALTQAGHTLTRGRAAVTISVAPSGPGGAEVFTIERHGTAVRVVGGDA